MHHNPNGMQSPCWLDARLLVQPYRHHANHARLSTVPETSQYLSYLRALANAISFDWNVSFLFSSHINSFQSKCLLSEVSARSH